MAFPKLQVSCISAGVACVGFLGIPATAGADRDVCCWGINVKAKGELTATFAGRATTDTRFPHQGPKRHGDFEGRSGLDFVWESRGLYRYKERGSGREFTNLAASKTRLQLNVRSD